MLDEQDALAALARTMQGRGNVSRSDLSTLFSPELAYLTGTFYQDPTRSAQDEDNLFRQYAPNMRLVLNLPDTDIRKIITNEIVNFGTAPWEVKRQIEEYTAKQAELNPGVFNQEGETKDLMSFADTVFRENNALQVQRSKESGGDDWAKVTGGLPRPELDFSPEQIAPELFEKVGQETQRLRVERGRTSISDKTKSAAMRFLEQQKTEASQREAERGKPVPHPSVTENESVLDSLRRNLANTAIAKGEAGVRGAVPLAKLAASPFAGLMGLYRGLTDPLYKEAEDTAKYIAQETVGRVGVPDISLGNDPVGKILYGRERPQMAGGQPVSDGSDVRAENVRFGRIAQDVVRRAEDPQRKAAASEAVKRQKWMDDFTKALSYIAQQKARAAGYTPYQEALTARRNFMAGGG